MYRQEISPGPERLILVLAGVLGLALGVAIVVIVSLHTGA